MNKRCEKILRTGENKNSFVKRKVFFGYNEILAKLSILLIVALYLMLGDRQFH